MGSPFSSVSIPVPKNWQDFERHCRVLFECILDDPSTQTHGRVGQQQDGVDIFGRRRASGRLVGVQCKGRTDNYGRGVTVSELRREVDKTKTFKPALDEFILVTTGPDDKRIQEAARLLQMELKETGRDLSIQVWGWETIEQQISEHDRALKAFHPDYTPISDQLLALSKQHKASSLQQDQKLDYLVKVAKGLEVHPTIERLSTKGIDEFAELLRLLFTPVTALGPITFEKGRFTHGSKPQRSKFWPEGSLFHFIDMGMRQDRTTSPFERFPNLVCDDGGVEVADFIGWDCIEPRVVFVHTKCGWQPRVSASTLQSVCSQVIKNLAYLRYGLPKLPGWRVRWEHPWSSGGHVLARLRAGTAVPAQARADLLSLLRRPTTRQEAWIVIGGTLPLGKLDDEVASGSPGPSVVQAMHMIIQTVRACAELKVGLRIFCPR